MRPGSRFGGLNGTGQLEWSHAPGATCTRPCGPRRPTQRGRSGTASVSLFVPSLAVLMAPFAAVRPVPARRPSPYACIPAVRRHSAYAYGEISDGLISLRPPQNTLV
jgi:hypothetical protein